MIYKPNMYDFSVQASQGFVQGVTTRLQTGYNPEIDSGTVPEDIWVGGGIWLAPTAPRIHNITSTSAADSGIGTGAQTIRVTGLPSWDETEISEIITLNGITAVPTVNAYVMINRMRVETVGTGLANAGDIVATALVDATVTSVIGAGDGESSQSMYGIPSTQDFHFTSFAAWLVETGGSANEIRLQAAFKLRADDPSSPFIDALELGVFGQGTSYMPFSIDPPANMEGPAIVKVRCLQVSANNAGIGAGFNGYLIDKRNI